MQFTFPQDDKYFSWTAHIKNKMLYYGLSESRIRRVLKSPTRTEEGIAPETIAVMQSSTTRKTPEEIWVMYQDKREKKKAKNLVSAFTNRKFLMISAWRYPGTTKPGASIPIPDDILDELERLA